MKKIAVYKISWAAFRRKLFRKLVYANSIVTTYKVTGVAKMLSVSYCQTFLFKSDKGSSQCSIYVENAVVVMKLVFNERIHYQ